jgi:Domain of unknown function (DUF4928)
MPMKLETELSTFYTSHKFNSKGKLSVALVITDHARKMGLPLDPAKLLTDRAGQVLGLGIAPVQKILSKYGIDKVLAREGGRTSRGSIDHMKEYVFFLNGLYARDLFDFDKVEQFWIEKVNLFFAGKPLKIKLDSSHGLRTLIRDLIAQGELKQKEAPGVNYVGIILQHLVGAKLDCALGKGRFKHNSASTSDAQTGRSGDFLIDKVAIHVTTAPTEFVISRCRDNLSSGLRPLIVTTKKGIALAEGNAENAGLTNRLDIFEVEQFIALNLYEFAKFEEKGRVVAVTNLVKRYNEIVDEFETDPSLQIEVQ